LGVSVVLVVASAGFAVGRGLGAWRTFRRTRRQLTDGTVALTRSVATMEQRLAPADAAAARLQHAQAELHESVTEARILVAAFADVRATVGHVTGLLPR